MCCGDSEQRKVRMTVSEESKMCNLKTSRCGIPFEAGDHNSFPESCSMNVKNNNINMGTRNNDSIH